MALFRQFVVSRSAAAFGDKKPFDPNITIIALVLCYLYTAGIRSDFAAAAAALFIFSVTIGSCRLLNIW